MLKKVSDNLKKGVSEWRTHKERKYLYISFANLTDSETIALTSLISKQFKESGLNNTLVITDLRDLAISVNLYSFLRTFSKEHQKYLLKSAIVGLSVMLIPFYKIHEKVTNTKAKVFETNTDAIDYILS